MLKAASFKIKGMQRDLSTSAFNSEYAYENKNIRITPVNENTLLSIINEKGTKLANIKGIGNIIKGIPIGQAQSDDELIIFTAGDGNTELLKDISPTIDTVKDITSEELSLDIDINTEDRIYKLWIDNNNLVGEVLYKGQLNFSYKYPIETLYYYENNEIGKIYWTDGINQPRVINIKATSDIIGKWNRYTFNFTRRLKLQEIVIINKDSSSSGSFSSGIIQYAFTYYSKYGQESNIFHTSPLYYISYIDRGASPEDEVGNSFNITIDNIDKNFDYIRIYSIHRTSIDATPTIKRVIDINIPTYSTYTVTKWKKRATINDIDVYDTKQQKYVSLSSFTPVSGETSDSWTFPSNIVNSVKFSDGDYLSIKRGKTLYLKLSNAIATLYYSDNTEMNIQLCTKSKINYTDNGTSGDIVDPTELLYIGGEEILCGTMAQKDNTLFLGDITLKRNLISSDIVEYFNGKSPSFSSQLRTLESPIPKGYYPYNNCLDMNSLQIKTFKYLETYRLGIQFQHYTGKWSEPIWMNDVRNTVHINSSYISQGKIYLPTATYSLQNTDIIKKLINQGYVKARPIIVYPSLQDRECICQGVLCPTVYNVEDRFSNSPFVQSSWFTRANAPFDLTVGLDWIDRDLGSPTLSSNSRRGLINNSAAIEGDLGNIKSINLINKGAWAEFRHNKPIPSTAYRNAEIQCIDRAPASPYINSAYSDEKILEWVYKYSNNFYIDQSIVTLHSPDIEFDDSIKNMDTSNLKLRIVGYVPLTACTSDIDIQTSTPANNYKNTKIVAPGFYKESMNIENISRFGYRGLISGAFWLDAITESKESAANPFNNLKTLGFIVYPWHRNGSLNNTQYATNGYRSAMLDKKKMSNLRFSFNSYYFNSNKVWNAYEKKSSTKRGISGTAIFNSNEVTLVRLPAPENSGLPDINYYGNIDKVITYPIYDDVTGYNIVVTDANQTLTVNPHALFTGNLKLLDSTITEQYYGTDPIRMKYKSSPHAVIALNYSTDHLVRVLPTLKDGNISSEETQKWDINPVPSLLDGDKMPFWEINKTTMGVSQDILDINIGPNVNGSLNGYGPEYGWLWIGELYRDNVQNRFGGLTEEAFENNQWISCGESVSLMSDNGISGITIQWSEGDTYYQRYDHLKTYPFTLEDQNSVVDIISFMCETRVNIDGRYDKNRGQANNLVTTPNNFNLINNVYNQQNNFFNYRAVNYEKQHLNKFSNIVTWTKTKVAGELTDTWTNITLASTLDFDGSNGNIRALKLFNNNLIAFQDTGISQILYNENMQISSTEGVPIEIANSGKVNGKRYLSNQIGCTNKWSICETPNGIYFIDDLSKGIFLFNGGFNNLSDKLGFHTWINTKIKSTDIWNPIDFEGFVTYYDKNNSDVLFISKDECLAFSELLGQFTSFYSYEHVPYFANLKDKGIMINPAYNSTTYRPWICQEGEYNIFFNKYHPFYTTIIANPDMPIDKIFNNIEFRADSWSGDTLLNSTFDTLTTWNEYQTGTIALNNVFGKPSSLKKKFRIWRANIPRDISNGRDRMRNPWLYLKLSMENENTNKTILHDIIVHYFE